MSRVRDIQKAQAERFREAAAHFREAAAHVSVQPRNGVRDRIVEAHRIFSRHRARPTDAYWQEGYEPTAEDRAVLPGVPTFDERFP